MKLSQSLCNQKSNFLHIKKNLNLKCERNLAVFTAYFLNERK